MILKLLFDQNLPASFVVRFAEAFPGSQHVKSLGLDVATDRQVWDYARHNGFAIVSKDSDFHQMSFLYGAPPKTIWVRSGNCGVADLAHIISQHLDRIAKFLGTDAEALLVVGRTD